MSTTVDNRVVEMQFNNKQFENNVQTSLGTLDKLKKSLKFKDASKSFESLDKSSKKLNSSFASTGSVLESVSLKFKALDVIAVTALQNITNRAINAGVALAKNLTIDQVSAGLDKYAEKTSSVQTIMAATASQFDDTTKQMEYVNEQLQRLNWFTDETSYNFVDMVSNVGKFTSNNVNLDTAVTAMQGIANWAAISGANSNEASRAMYNLSQAISVGALKLMDWKSIQLANMGTAEFKQTAIDTAVSLGTLTKEADGAYKTLEGTIVSVKQFDSSLSDSWLSSEVLLETLNKYGAFTQALNEAVDYTGISTSRMLGYIEDFQNGTLDINEALKGTDLTAQQMTTVLKVLSDETFDFGRKAFRAAQESKTFAESISYTKDAASTAWMNIFEQIIGNYEQAKEVWTAFSEDLYDIFIAPLEDVGALFSDWNKLGGRTSFLEGLRNIMDALKQRIELVREAFEDIFPPKTAEQMKELTDRFRDFTAKLKLNEGKAAKLKSVLKGLFAVFDIFGTVAKALVSGALQVLNALFGGFGETVLDASASLGDLIVGFRDWIKQNNRIGNAISKVTGYLVKAITTVRGWIKAFLELPLVTNAIEKTRQGLSFFFNNVGGWVSSAIGYIGTVIKNLKEMDKISFKNIVDSFTKMKDGAEGTGSAVVETLKKISTSVSTFESSVYDSFTGASGGTNGLTKAVGKLGEVFRSTLSKIDVNKLLAVGAGVSIIVVLFKLSKSLTTLTNAVANFASPFKALSNAITSFKKRSKAQDILTYAKAMTLLAVSVALLGYTAKGGRLWEAVAALGAVAAGIIVFVGAMTLLSKVTKTTGGTVGIGAAVFGIAAGVAILVGAMKSLQQLTNTGDSLWEAVGIIGVLAAGLAGLGVVVGLFAPKVGKSALFFITFAIALKTLVSALTKIEATNLDDVKDVMFQLIAIFGAVALATRIAKVRGVVVLLGTVLALKLLIGQMKSLRDLDEATIQAATENMLKLLKGFLPVLIVSFLAGKNAAKAGAMILMISVAIALLLNVIKGLSSISDSELGRGTAAIGSLIAMFALLIIATKKAQKCAGTVAAFSLVIITLSLALAALSLIDSRDLLSTAVGLSAVLFALGLALKQVGNMKGVKTTGIVAIGILLGEFVVIMAVLAQFNTGALVKGGVGLLALVGVLILLMRSLNGLKVEGGAANSLMVVAIIIGVLGGVMYVIGGVLDTKGAITAVGSMVILMGSIIAMLAVMKNMKVDSSVTTNLIVMGAIVTVLGGLLIAFGLLCGQVDPLSLISFAGAIGVILLSLSASTAILTKFGKGKISTNAYAALGALTVVVGLIGGLLYIMVKDGTQYDQAIPIAIAMATILGMFTALLVPLTLIGALGWAGLAGVGTLAALIVGMGAVVVGVGALNGETGKLEKFLNQGIPVFEAVGEAIGNFFGGIVAGWMNSVGNALPAFGQSLADFGEKIKPFIETFTADYNTENMVALAEGLASAALAISAVGVASVIDKIATLFNGGKSPLEQLVETMKKAVPGLKEIGDADINAEKVKVIAESLLDLATAASRIPNSGGLWGKIVGNNDLGDFAEQFSSLATGLTTLSGQVDGETLKKENIEKATQCLTLISDVAKDIPNSGGLWGKIVGDNDISFFADQFEALATGLTTLSTNVDGEKLNKANIQKATESLELIAKAADEIPNSGGWIGAIFGENDMDAFGDKMDGLGSGLVDLSKHGENINPTYVQNAATGLVKMAEAAGELAKVVAYSSITDSITDSVIENPFLGGWGWLKALFGEDEGEAEDTYKYITDFISVIDSAGDSLSTASSKFEGVNSEAIVAASVALSALANTYSEIKEANPSRKGTAISDLISAFANVGYDGIDAFIEACQLSGPTVKNAVAGLFDDAKSAVDYKTEDLETTLGESFRSAVPVYTDWAPSIDMKLSAFISELRDAFKKEADIQMPRTGKYVVDGLVKGIEQNLSSAKTAGIKIGRAVDEGMRSKDGLDIHSPSVKGIEVGNYVVDGVIVGTEEKLPELEKTAAQMYSSFLQNNSERRKNLTAIGDQYSEMAQEAVDSIKEQLNGFSENSIVALIKDRINGGKDTMSSIIDVFTEKGISWDSNTIDFFLGLLDKTGITGGEALAEGVAYGYSSSTVIEESIEDKIKSVADAYEKSLKYFDTRKSTVDLEYQLWEKTLGVDASDSEKLAAEIAAKTRQYEIQAQKVVEAEKKYRDVLAIEGATSKETQEYYNEYLQEQIDLAELQTSIREYQEQMVESQKEAAQKQNEALQVYAKLIYENKDALMELGFSMQEIEEWARDASGYDPTAIVEDQTEKASEALSAAEKTLSEYDTIFANNAEEYGKTLGTGIQNGSESSMQTLSAAMTSCAEMLLAHSDEWKNAGKTLMDVFTGAINDCIPSVKQSLSNVVESSSGFLKEAIAKITATLKEDLDSVVTITPVLNLSQLRRDAQAANRLVASTSYGLAGDIGSGSSGASQASDNGGMPKTATPSVSFVQNNYSPKALSRLEIYRQTNNQISMLKKKGIGR